MPKKSDVIPVGMYDTPTPYEGTGYHPMDSGGWDSGQVGFLYVMKDRLRNETGYNEQELFSTDRKRKPQKGDHVKADRLAPNNRKRKHNWGRVIKVKRNGDLVVDFNNGYIEAVRRTKHIVQLHPSEITEVMPERGLEMLRADLKMWDQWARGNIYGYKIFKLDDDEEPETLPTESCWGFYGNFNEYMLPECRSIVDTMVESARKSHFKALKDCIRNCVPLYKRHPFNCLQTKMTELCLPVSSDKIMNN